MQLHVIDVTISFRKSISCRRCFVGLWTTGLDIFSTKNRRFRVHDKCSLVWHMSSHMQEEPKSINNSKLFIQLNWRRNMQASEVTHFRVHLIFPFPFYSPIEGRGEPSSRVHPHSNFDLLSDGVTQKLSSERPTLSHTHILSALFSSHDYSIRSQIVHSVSKNGGRWQVIDIPLRFDFDHHYW